MIWTGSLIRSTLTRWPRDRSVWVMLRAYLLMYTDLASCLSKSRLALLIGLTAWPRRMHFFSLTSTSTFFNLNYYPTFRYRSLLSERLLQLDDYNVEKEERNLECLKVRFGEDAMSQCDVMLKDIAASRRISSRIFEVRLYWTFTATLAAMIDRTWAACDFSASYTWRFIFVCTSVVSFRLPL